jgi:hypothetical protein
MVRSSGCTRRRPCHSQPAAIPRSSPLQAHSSFTHHNPTKHWLPSNRNLLDKRELHCGINWTSQTGVLSWLVTAGSHCWRRACFRDFQIYGGNPLKLHYPIQHSYMPEENSYVVRDNLDNSCLRGLGDRWKHLSVTPAGILRSGAPAHFATL